MSVAKAVCGAVSMRLLFLPRRRPAALETCDVGSSRVARGPDGKTGRPRYLRRASSVGPAYGWIWRADSRSAADAQPVPELGPGGAGAPSGLGGGVAGASQPGRVVGPPAGGGDGQRG